MTTEEQFLPGFEPKKPKPEDKKDDSPVLKPEFLQTKTDEDTEDSTCPYCEIHGSFGCPRHRRK